MSKSSIGLTRIGLTREGKYWLAKDTLSGVSSFGKTKKRAYRALAEALALYLKAAMWSEGVE